MAEYDEKVFARLLDIAQRHRNCLDEHKDIILQCPKKLMSRGIDLYGMFWPDSEIGKYFTYKGRLTKNEKSRHYSTTLMSKSACVLPKDLMMMELY